MSKTALSFGPLTVSFSEDHFCRNMLDTMYGDLPKSSSNVDIKVTGHDWRETEIPPSYIIRASDRISVNDCRHHVDEVRSYSPPKKWVIDRIGQRGYALAVDGWESETLSIDVYYDGKLYENTLAPLRYYLKFKNWTYSEYCNIITKNFTYNILEPICQAWMLKKGYTFLHAGSISADGSGIALTGWGGAGKTSATSALVKRSDKMKFLSDDLAILTSQGELHPYYKSSVIYPYNTEGEYLPESNFLSGYSDQLHWNLHKLKNGKKGVRRRISPKKLFGEQVGSPGPRPLEQIVFLSRERRDKPNHESITSEELARRSTAVILDELDWLIEYSSTVRAAGSMCIDPINIIQRTESVYQNCFNKTETVLLRIPKNTPPNELAEYIEEFIICENTT